MKTINVKKIVLSTLTIIAAIFILAYSGKLAESVDAGEIVVIQDPIDGELHVYTQPGWATQNFGEATHYRKSSQFWFNKDNEAGDKSVKIRFNDGGHAQISGSVRWDMPVDEKAMIKIHSTFRSQEAIETALIATVMQKSIYMTGPLMSSAESYNTRRNSLISYIEDQAVYGVYKTRTKEVKGTDPMTGIEKNYSVVEIIEDTAKHLPTRQEESPIAMYGVKMYNFSPTSIDYDSTVEQQIATQQKAIMQVQTAIAEAKEAEQKAITVAKKGEADAAQAKWAQEVIKATAVTEAQQQLEVQALNTKQAELYKKQLILEGEGEGAKKRAIMIADGALEKKLETYLEVQRLWAEAFSKYAGAIVPQIQTGSNGARNGAIDFMEVMGMKATKDLALDLSNKK